MTRRPIDFIRFFACLVALCFITTMVRPELEPGVRWLWLLATAHVNVYIAKRLTA